MPADVVFLGGAVFTGSGAPRHDIAVAVVGTKISELVPLAEVDRHIGPDTQVVQLDGALLSPGFQDSHVHPAGAGIELLGCDLSPSVSADDAARLISEYVAAHPEGWILGGGWSMDDFPGGTPLRATLDALVGDRPALLSSRDHHSVWASTAAIVAAGITADTPDPADGRVEREPDGYPAGTFQEGAADLFSEVRPLVSDDDAYAGLLLAQKELLAQGITGWQDALIGEAMGIGNALGSYRRANEEGVLQAHVVGSQWWERDRGLEQVHAMIERRAEYADRDPARFNLGTVKIMVDGVAENFTAAMLRPYQDGHGHATANDGLSFVDPERLKEYVTVLDREGFQVHFHAVGDRAVKEALDAVEAARTANGPSDNRHHIAHIQVIAEADTKRFAELGVVANMQPLWAVHESQMDDLTLPFLDESAQDRQYPFGDLHRYGAPLAAGSDWPVSTANPILGMHVAVNRTVPDADPNPLGGAQQCLDLPTAWAAYTSGTAFVNHREHDTGSIAPGYLANLIVVSPDPFSEPTAQIHRSEVTATWVDGQQVYTRTT